MVTTKAAKAFPAARRGSSGIRNITTHSPPFPVLPELHHLSVSQLPEHLCYIPTSSSSRMELPGTSKQLLLGSPCYGCSMNHPDPTENSHQASPDPSSPWKRYSLKCFCQMRMSPVRPRKNNTPPRMVFHSFVPLFISA